MASVLAWWRRLGSTLMAGAMALLMLGPTLDAVTCFDETMPAAVAQSADGVALADGAGSSDRHHPDDPQGFCSHGHCHHAGQYVPAQGDAPAPPGPAAEPHRVLRAAALASLAPSGLERPPRA